MSLSQPLRQHDPSTTASLEHKSIITNHVLDGYDELLNTFTTLRICQHSLHDS